ncbi:MAG: glycosyltransferase family 39 protein [Burkholderiales bacterium]|nr:glycosyltransferase family 39 protein [Burkholderiales bacterium]
MNAATTGADAGRKTARRITGGTAAVAVPVAVVLVALLVRLHDLGSESIWLDEAYSFGFARPDRTLKEVVWATGGDFHPPLYYLVLHEFLRFGQDAFWLRLPSALCGALAAGAVAVAGRVAAGTVAGLIAGLLFALAPTPVAYAQEARMYALLSLEIGVGLAAFLWLARDRARLFPPPRAVLGSGRGTALPVAWVLLSAAIGTAMLTHNLGVYFPVLVGLAVLMLWRAGPDPHWRDLATAAIFGVLGLLLWLPWVPYLAKQLKQVSGGYWIAAPTSADVLRDFVALTLGREEAALGLAAVLVALALVAFAFARAHEDRRTFALLTLFALGPIALALVVNLWRPLYLPRTLSWVAIPVFVLVAAALVRLPSRALTVALTITLLAVTGYQTQRYFATQSKPGWAEIVSYLAGHWQNGDAVVIHRASAILPFDFHRHAATLRTAMPDPIGIADPADAAMALLPPGTRRVWLIYSFADQDDRDRHIRRTFADGGRIVETRDFGGPPDLGRPTVTLIELRRTGL